MTTLTEIEELTRAYSDSRRELAENARALEEAIAAEKRRRLPSIRALIEEAASRKAAVKAAVEESPGLFKRPKTRIFHGVRVGFAKAKGKITFPAGPEAVVKFIRRIFPERFESLVKTTETPIKSALNQLSGADLKRIGVAIGEDVDSVVVAPTDSEIEKLIDALLKDEETA